MPILTIPPDQQTQQQMLYVIGAAMLAGFAHVGKLLLDNKPVPLRQAIGSSILTLCVGGAGGALCTAYWHIPAAVMATGAVIVGFIGGPFILLLIGKVGERALQKKAEQIASTLGEEGER